MINLDGLEGFDNLEDLNKELQKRASAHNKRGLADFDGLSPEQMAALQNFPLSNGPLAMNKLSEKELKKCPLLMQVRFLIDKMKAEGEVKLTKTDALPPKLAQEIYGLGHLKDDFIENGLGKLNKEGDVKEIQLTRILLENSSLVKKRKGKLSLTKIGEKHANDGNFILQEILRILLHKFNWSYYDGFDSETIGQVNTGFSLFLLKKYGSEKRNGDFYAEKYFKAFPWFMEEGERSFRCYTLRTFQRYFKFIGFVDMDERKILEPVFLKKTAFFDQLLSLE